MFALSPYHPLLEDETLSKWVTPSRLSSRQIQQARVLYIKRRRFYGRNANFPIQVRLMDIEGTIRCLLQVNVPPYVDDISYEFSYPLLGKRRLRLEVTPRGRVLIATTIPAQ